METFKVKYQGKEIDICVRNPKSEEVREAEKIKSIAYNNALYKDGLPLLVTAREQALKRNIWGPDKQKELQDCYAELERCENTLTKERGLKLGGPNVPDENTMFRIALKCQTLRERIVGLRTVFSDMESKTVEGYAENERLNYMIYATTVYKDSGERFFSSFEDFKNSTYYTEENAEKYTVALMAYAKYQNKMIGEYQKSIDNNPENKFFKRFKFVNENGQFVNKDGHLVNIDGELVDEDGILLKDKVKDEKPKPYLDDNGNPILDEEYLKELEEYNKRNNIVSNDIEEPKP